MSTMHPQDWADLVHYNEQGLVNVIAQDARTGRILMVAWMNREALQLTADTHIAHYWSRSRAKLWKKGEESGHLQRVEEIRLDCDGDAVLLLIEQVGGIACHTGRESCFYRRLEGSAWIVTDAVKKDPQAIYGKPDAH
ncbi:phosphoribosyl-AMP cyclohydrolase [Microvirgula curvata]|uniref:Phosphoribosyl-AMP cyclohydrolase n=2 Tax=Aquaspirillaceae TaxID=2897176 RepID=A0A2S0P9J2_9NEIS|nr:MULTISPECIES: phosphoribosyl-AMP cyclohydrolase [Microvirgula]AVY93963.1 phosphoribosyl-AMP cyclohydrolase [Microvirgula aerodenitrificans]RAS11463.1 phosphoribosyl-AMP cyclohydrolase [Microvirgula sp. AG722]